MKNLNLKTPESGFGEVLTREQLKNVLGGRASTTLTCYCSCNSGIGTQPSFTTNVSNYDSSKTYVPGEANCGCSSLYFTTQPGYNGGSCSVSYFA